MSTHHVHEADRRIRAEPQSDDRREDNRDRVRPEALNGEEEHEEHTGHGHNHPFEFEEKSTVNDSWVGTTIVIYTL